MVNKLSPLAGPVDASGEPRKAWNVDDVQAELQKPGYSILRGWLAIHGGASARIALEEMCQLIRAAAVPSSPAQPNLTATLRALAIYCFQKHGNDAYLYNALADPQKAIELLRRWQAEDAALPAEVVPPKRKE